MISRVKLPCVPNGKKLVTMCKVLSGTIQVKRVQKLCCDKINIIMGGPRMVAVVGMSGCKVGAGAETGGRRRLEKRGRHR